MFGSWAILELTGLASAVRKALRPPKRDDRREPVSRPDPAVQPLSVNAHKRAAVGEHLVILSFSVVHAHCPEVFQERTLPKKPFGFLDVLRPWTPVTLGADVSGLGVRLQRLLVGLDSVLTEQGCRLSGG